MSLLCFILIGQTFLSTRSIRQDSGASLERTVPWSSEEYPLFGEPNGKIGVQVEIALPTKSIKDWGKMAILGQNVDKITSAVTEQMSEQGIAATVKPNDCKCFLPGGDGTHTLPFLITVEGVADYQKFGKAQLATITKGLYEQLTSGVAVPAGAQFSAATDASGKAIKDLKAELEDNPQLHGAVESVSLQQLKPGSFRDLEFSDRQFLLEVELNKYALIASKVGNSSALAYLAGKAGAGKSEDIARTVYGLLAEQLVGQVSKNGINILISSPEYASKHFSAIGALTEGAANALHVAGHSVIKLEEEMVDLDNERTAFAGNVVPAELTQWKRTIGKSGKVFGFRLVMTVTSVNEKFALGKLPLLRDGIAGTLRNALPENLKKTKFRGKSLFDPTVLVKGCGWKPPLASQPPFPHDEAGCHEAASYVNPLLTPDDDAVYDAWQYMA